MGIDNSRNGNLCAVVSAPISPGPEPSASTATSGTAARLICSADCAARFGAGQAREDGRKPVFHCAIIGRPRSAAWP